MDRDVAFCIGVVESGRRAISSAEASPAALWAVIVSLVVARRSGQASHPSSGRYLQFATSLGPLTQRSSRIAVNHKLWFMVGATHAEIKRTAEAGLASAEQGKARKAPDHSPESGVACLPRRRESRRPSPHPWWNATSRSTTQEIN
jgi:hypothetical protein